MGLATFLFIPLMQHYYPLLPIHSESNASATVHKWKCWVEDGSGQVFWDIQLMLPALSEKLNMKSANFRMTDAFEDKFSGFLETFPKLGERLDQHYYPSAQAAKSRDIPLTSRHHEGSFVISTLGVLGLLAWAWQTRCGANSLNAKACLAAFVKLLQPGLTFEDFNLRGALEHHIDACAEGIDDGVCKHVAAMIQGLQRYDSDFSKVMCVFAVLWSMADLCPTMLGCLGDLYPAFAEMINTDIANHGFSNDSIKDEPARRGRMRCRTIQPELRKALQFKARNKRVGVVNAADIANCGLGEAPRRWPEKDLAALMSATHRHGRLAAVGDLVACVCADGVRIGRPLEETVVFGVDLAAASVWAAPIVISLRGWEHIMNTNCDEMPPIMTSKGSPDFINTDDK